MYKYMMLNLFYYLKFLEEEYGYHSYPSIEMLLFYLKENISE